MPQLFRNWWRKSSDLRDSRLSFSCLMSWAVGPWFQTLFALFSPVQQKLRLLLCSETAKACKQKVTKGTKGFRAVELARRIFFGELDCSTFFAHSTFIGSLMGQARPDSGIMRALKKPKLLAQVTEPQVVANASQQSKNGNSTSNTVPKRGSRL